MPKQDSPRSALGKQQIVDSSKSGESISLNGTSQSYPTNIHILKSPLRPKSKIIYYYTFEDLPSKLNMLNMAIEHGN